MLLKYTYFDPAAYRPEGEAAERWANDDPIQRQRDALANAGVGDAQIKEAKQAADAEMIAALAAATAAPWPADNTVYDDVQDIGSPVQEAF